MHDNSAPSEPMGLMTPEEAAQFLGTSVRHIRRLVAERRLAHRKIGRYVRFDRRDLDAFITANTVPALGGAR